MFFYEDFKVRFADLDHNYQASARSLLNYCEECSILHSDSLGMGLQQLIELHQGWFLTKSFLYIKNPSFFQQKLRVESWISKLSGSKTQAVREYHLFDEQGMTLAHRKSNWVHIDLSTRKPIALAKKIAEKLTISPPLLQQSFSNFAHQSYDKELEYQILHNHIDCNGHVNSIYYTDWAIGVIEPILIKNYSPIIIETHFISELTYGSTVKVAVTQLKHNPYNYIEKDAHDLIFDHTVYHGDGRVSARFYTVWKQLDD